MNPFSRIELAISVDDEYCCRIIDSVPVAVPSVVCGLQMYRLTDEFNVAGEAAGLSVPPVGVHVAQVGDDREGAVQHGRGFGLIVSTWPRTTFVPVPTDVDRPHRSDLDAHSTGVAGDLPLSNCSIFDLTPSHWAATCRASREDRVGLVGPATLVSSFSKMSINRCNLWSQ